MSFCGVTTTWAQHPTTWAVEEVAEFVDEDKNGVIDMACDEELIVVGLSGWSGEAKVYDIKTGEKKFVLKSNTLGDTPAPFSHDNILVWLGKSIIVTIGTNDNTLSIWDRSGTLLAQDLHKDNKKIADMKRIQEMEDEEKEAYFEGKTANMSEEEKYGFMMQIAFGVVPNEKKLVSLEVKEDMIYGGFDGGFFVIGNVDGEWKIVKEVKLGYEVDEIKVAGQWIAIGKVSEGKKVFGLWDPELGLNDLNAELKYFRSCEFIYPHIFMIGGRGDVDKTGVEIWNVEKGEMVRHLLKGEKRYEYIKTNGKFLAVCEHINSWTSGEEKMLKLAVYNVDQILDQDVPEARLWSECFEYSTLDLGSEHIRAVFNEKNLIVNHGRTKFSIMDIIKK
jgi:WD40 repeat protein